MRIESAPIDESTIRIELDGRMDVPGSLAIDPKFTALTATRAARVIVDLSRVTFLASLGIRTLVSNAKALKLRGGRMVLLGPDPVVRKVLALAGIDQVIPVCDDLAAARAAVAES